MAKASKWFSALLMVYSVFMLAWGLLGFLEYFTRWAPLVPLQNPTFPAGTQFLHWLLISLTGAVYLVGYIKRWAYTPLLMILLYGMLASMCFIQTFDFMTNPGRYLAYAIECTLYIVLSSYLLSSERIRAHFGQLPLGGR